MTEVIVPFAQPNDVPRVLAAACLLALGATEYEVHQALQLLASKQIPHSPERTLGEIAGALAKVREGTNR